MELSELVAELDTDLAGAAARLEQPAPGPTFTLPANRFQVHKAKAEVQASRRGIKALIRPEHARTILPHLPDPGGRTHCILRGDFVLCELIPAITRARGPALDVHIATLGMSTANAQCLAELRARGQIGALTIICSHYFQQVDKATTYREVAAALAGVGRLVVARSHAKVICLPTAAGDHFVIEGSANLRSSDNLEQMVIFNDPEALGFHRAWMDDLATATPA